MYYVSSLKGEKIGVTDTKDGVEEFYSDTQIVSFLKEHNIDIYGTSYYNYKSNSKPIKINQTLQASELENLLLAWKKNHNQWSGHPVEDYLASAKIGTKVAIKFADKASDGRVFSDTYVIRRLDYDTWLFMEGANNHASGQTGNSRFAGWVLEVAYVYSKPLGIKVF